MRSAFIVAACAGLCAAPAFASDTYVIDPDHSYPTFQVSHQGLSLLLGRFNKIQGKITLDRAAKSGSISVDIDMASVDTGLDRRDTMLAGENWFNTQQFPTMSYKATSLRFNGDEVAGADGELTLKGVTRPVSLTVDHLRCGVGLGKRETCGATASATIKRMDFGVKASPGGVGDEVKITINLEAYKEGA